MHHGVGGLEGFGEEAVEFSGGVDEVVVGIYEEDCCFFNGWEGEGRGWHGCGCFFLDEGWEGLMGGMIVV